MVGFTWIVGERGDDVGHVGAQHFSVTPARANHDGASVSLDAAESKRPSVGYYLSIAGGCLGLMFTIFTLSGIWQARHGHDPIAGMGGIGTVGFAFSYTPAFVMRLIFWPKSSRAWKASARLFITVVFTASLLGTATAVILLLTGPAGPRPGFSASDIVAAALFQIGAVVWLVRYRPI